MMLDPVAGVFSSSITSGGMLVSSSRIYGARSLARMHGLRITDPYISLVGIFPRGKDDLIS